MAVTKLTTNLNNVQALDNLPNDVQGLTPAELKEMFDKAGNDIKTYLNDTLTAEIDTLHSQNVKVTGDQTVAGVKTFTSSPIVPTPTADTQASTKKYVDDKDTTRKNYVDTNFPTKTEISDTRKLSPTGDFTGSWHGIANPTYADPGIANVVAEHSTKIGDITSSLQSQWVNVLYPPVPFVAVKGNANYLNPTDHKYYKDSEYTQLADNDTTALQNLLNGFSDGSTLFFPCKCRVTSEVLISKTLNLIGKNKYSCGICNDGTGNAVRIADTIERGTIRDLLIWGNDTTTYSPNSTTLSGLVFENCYAWYINNVWIRGHGEYGIKFNKGNYTQTFDHCDIENNKLDGCYMVGQAFTGNNQVNAITITKCHIANNGRHGINTWGNSINIVQNTIEGNKNSGIILSYDYVSGAYNSSNINIKENYFELNGDGFINTKSINTGTIRTITHILIEDNYGTMSLSQVNPGVSYLCNFTGTGTLSSTSLSNLTWRNNTFTATGGLNIANFNSLPNETCLIEQIGTSAAQYVNMGGARVEYQKRLVVQGYFYAKGATYTNIDKSDSITAPADVVFPLPLTNYELPVRLGIYVDTDHTAYTMKFKIFRRDAETVNSYTEIYAAETLNKTAAGLVQTTTMDAFGGTDNKRLIYPLIDCYVVVNIVSASGGSYLKLGNLIVRYS